MTTIWAMIALVLGFFLVSRLTVLKDGPTESVLVLWVPVVPAGKYQLPDGDAVVVHARASNETCAPE